MSTSETTAGTTGNTTEKKVDWAELFFDLVVVFAVTQVSALLHDDHSWAGTGKALLVFVPVYWTWGGTSVYANTHDLGRPLDRLGIFTLGLCGLLMALAVPGAFGDRGVLFGAAYLVARVTLAALVFRRGPLAATPVSVSVVVTGPLLLAGGFLDGPARVALWTLAAAVDLASPRLTRKVLMRVAFDVGHLTERFGLLVIIALGESVVAIGVPVATAPHLAAGPLTAVIVAFVLTCGLWWVYFHFAAGAVRHGMETAAVPVDVMRHVLSYGHLAFIGAIIAVAVGMAEAVAHPADHLHLPVAALLYGGCAAYLAVFGYTRWRMFHTWSTTRLTTAALVLALLPVATTIPALAALTVLAAAVLLLNTVEYTMAARHAAAAPSSA
ncbi:low temperature requirement protein A [Streptomyces sp. NBC_00536]|uniref:low temperature requirement protein A n=1 Tax=Streptomyces sp. NBC_00536 TaxID=2975769 RepID=UPI002E8138DB|nr:low temperature requirement protein A [Streptomyces sp. NBC_00536]WUC83377.1 low temperature requirement protein A [Streptomyces sp. NBC_00536]